MKFEANLFFTKLSKENSHNRLRFSNFVIIKYIHCRKTLIIKVFEFINLYNYIKIELSAVYFFKYYSESESEYFLIMAGYVHISHFERRVTR